MLLGAHLLLAMCFERVRADRRIDASVAVREPWQPRVYLQAVSGILFAVDLSSGAILWQTDTGGPLLRAADSSKGSAPVPTVDGGLFLPEKDTLLPWNIQELVAVSPFHTDEGTTFVGKKEAVLKAVDRDTGKPSKRFTDKESLFTSAESNLLWITRTDFSIQAVERDRVLVAWNVSYAEVLLGTSESRSGLFSPLSVWSNLEGAVRINLENGIVWELDLSSPVSSAFLEVAPNRIQKIPFRFEKSSHPGFSNQDSSSITPYRDLFRPQTRPISEVLRLLSSGEEESRDSVPSQTTTQNDSHGRIPAFTVHFHLPQSFLSLSLFIAITICLLPMYVLFRHRILLAKSRKSGRIEIDFNAPLGYGSHGTVVYSGNFEGRPVAVKRMLKEFIDSAGQEMELLMQSDAHPNVVRYYAKEADGNFVYLALELCQQTLEDLVKKGYRDSELLRSILRQTVEGVSHLHSLNIVHRDLKPANILITEDGKIKIADMGLGKKLDTSQLSFSSPMGHGSIGWHAPEILTRGRATMKVDIFSLGCVIAYVLTHGQHPFGDEPTFRDRNILDHKFSIDSKELSLESYNLIMNMIAHDPEQRPCCEEVLSHPFFWSDEEKLDFICFVSDRVEIEKPDSFIRRKIESVAWYALGEGPWNIRIDSGLIENLGKYRKYNFLSLRDLLRVIRNKRNHFRDLPEELQWELGTIPSGFLQYFCVRFPKLLLTSYIFAGAVCSQEPSFSKFYKGFSESSIRRMQTKLNKLAKSAPTQASSPRNPDASPSWRRSDREDPKT